MKNILLETLGYTIVTSLLILWAVFAFLLGTRYSPREWPERFSINVAGSQLEFNTGNVIVDQARQTSPGAVSDSLIEALGQAVSFVRSEEFDKAITLLESLEEQAPVAALYNNLGY